MLKINRNLSVTLSLIISFVVGGGLLVPTVMMPYVLKAYIKTTERMYLLNSYGVILTLFYGAIVFAITAIAALILLLLYVRSGNVYSANSVSCLRVISWACMSECVVFAALSFYFILALLISAAALFMCLLLRVVKNVIEEATAIKNENDMTI